MHEQQTTIQSFDFRLRCSNQIKTLNFFISYLFYLLSYLLSPI